MAEVPGVPKLNAKKCHLTKKGLQVLQTEINKLETCQQSNIALAASCECDRNTISKIRAGKYPVTRSKIESLFSYLGLDLEPEHWEECKGSPTAPVSTKDKKQHSPTQNTSLSRAQQVAELLWILNCKEQVHEFGIASESGNSAQAFVVQASEVSIQKWLVKRLTRDRECAARYPFGVASHKMRWEFDAFWEDFARKLHLPSPEPQQILESLCEQSQTKPVIIAAYGLNNLPKIREQILQEFWEPLTARYCAQPPKSFRSRLYLFLSDQPTDNGMAKNHPSSCLLPQLTEISVNEVRDWIGRDQVYAALRQLIQEDAIEDVVERELPGWETPPSRVIDNVCDLFQLEYGRAEIERFWELAG